jgi:hypothetical protein
MDAIFNVLDIIGTFLAPVSDGLSVIVNYWNQFLAVTDFIWSGLSFIGSVTSLVGLILGWIG